MTNDMSLEELINDPMIAMLNRADNVDERQFAQIMQSASRVLARQQTYRPPPKPAQPTSRAPIKRVGFEDVKLLVGKRSWSLPIIKERDLCRPWLDIKKNGLFVGRQVMAP